MDLTRRDFLKSLMVVAGVATIGAPFVIDTEIDALPSVNAATVESNVAMGRWGRVRINDEWYPLRNCGLTMQYDTVPALQASDFVVYHPAPVGSIELDMTLGERLTTVSFDERPYQICIEVLDQYAVAHTFMCEAMLVGLHDYDVQFNARSIHYVRRA